MVYRHARRRRKKARIRVKRFKTKVQPKDVIYFFKENIGYWVPNLESYLRLDALLEKEALDLIQENVKKGLIREEDKSLYLAFWRKTRELGQTYSAKTLKNAWNELVEEFTRRGLLKDKLLEIVELVKDQLPRKKIFEQTKEWVTLVDWLKFKALAYVTPITKFELEILPLRAIEFYYSVVPLAYRVFSLLPKYRLEFYKAILPLTIREFDINLVNKISINLLYEITRYLTFTFWLRPKYRLIFDYELIAITFRRFSLIPRISYEFSYGILPLTTRIFEIKDFLSYQLLYSVTPIPYRVFEFRNFFKLSFSYYIPTVNLMYSEITPLPKVEGKMYTPTTSINKTEIRPKIQVEFSYSIRQA
jgi:ASC-1-like (ASCH) protein